MIEDTVNCAIGGALTVAVACVVASRFQANNDVNAARCCKGIAVVGALVAIPAALATGFFFYVMSNALKR